MPKQTLVVLYGGRSAEREVSLMSATNVISAIDREKFLVKAYFIAQNGDFYRVDDLTKLLTNESLVAAAKVSPAAIYEPGAIAYPVLHGPMGEDGTIQGFLETLKMPYVGPSTLFAALTMDKIISKQIFAQFDLPQVPYMAIFEGADIPLAVENIDDNLTYPLFVKPANMGSSVGISKVTKKATLQTAIEEALKFDSRIIVEQGIVDPREIECSVIGNNDIKVAFPGEVLQDAEFYDYDSKYIDQTIINDVPAKISEAQAKQIQDYSLIAYRATAGQGSARCDFFIDTDDQIYLNEINTIPGFTKFSMFPALWKNMGLDATALISQLVEYGLEAYQLKESHFQ